MSYRIALIPTTPTGETLPLLKQIEEASLDKESIEKIVGVVPEIKMFIQNAKLETKMSLLSGQFVGKEQEVYLREKSLDWFCDYLEQLPIKLAEARRKQIIEEAKKKTEKKTEK